jgi:hypothetical protein
MSEFMFCPGVTMWHLNPLNHALRNDYIGNLLTIGASILPMVHSTFGWCIVTEAFVSRSAMDDVEFKEEISTGNCIKCKRPEVSDNVLIEGLKRILMSCGKGFSIGVTFDEIIFLKNDLKGKFIKVNDKIVWEYKGD